MTQPRHTVCKGDTLWAISKTYLGDPFQWPRIWRYNNRPEVIRITGREFPNPDLIYPDQVLLIPQLPGKQNTAPVSPPKANGATKSAGGGSLTQQLGALTEKAAYIFHLPDVVLPIIVTPNFNATIKMTGKVVLSRETGEPLVNLSSRGGVSYKSQVSATHAFGELMSENDIELDLAKGRLKFSSKMISKSNHPYAPSQRFGAGISSLSGLPTVNAAFSYPSLKGNIGGWDFHGLNVSYIVEVTPTGSGGGNRGPLEESVIAPTQDPRPYSQNSSALAKTVGGTLIVAAGIVIVGTIVEDFLTLGAGVADDPASFAAAGGLFTGGRALWAGRAVLPSFKSVIRFGGGLTVIGAGAPAAARNPSKNNGAKK